MGSEMCIRDRSTAAAVAAAQVAKVELAEEVDMEDTLLGTVVIASGKAVMAALVVLEELVASELVTTKLLDQVVVDLLEQQVLVVIVIILNIREHTPVVMVVMEELEATVVLLEQLDLMDLLEAVVMLELRRTSQMVVGTIILNFVWVLMVMPDQLEVLEL